jgi:hypothetical protein
MPESELRYGVFANGEFIGLLDRGLILGRVGT